ncbi:MAG: response regulator, partial [Lachnospiraceae bacterium]|nr:response regulator [Lachnospiraceae bacterium]
MSDFDNQNKQDDMEDLRKELEKLKLENEKRIECEHISNIAMNEALQQDHPEDEIKCFLASIGRQLDVDRIYIFEDDFEKNETSNTYEWCAENVEPEIENLQNIPRSILTWWYDPFEEGRNIRIVDLEAIRDTEPESYAYLKPQGINSLIANRVIIGERIVGFFGVDNPHLELMDDISSFLNTLSNFLSVLIQNRNIMRSLEARYIDERDIAYKANQAKSVFLAQMSHEIRTPINAVLGMNEMILRESDDSNILEYSQNINSAGKNLLNLINGILDFSKIEDGKMEILPAKYDTVSFINNLYQTIIYRSDSKGLELMFDIDETLPKAMRGDDVRLTQIIMNLLTNAVKYTEKGVITLAIKTIDKTESDITVSVSVKDTGIGIKEEDKPRLFESFERLDEIKNRHIEGTGLGMSIVTSLLGMMDSELCFESSYGEGSNFYFNLKQGIEDPAPIGDYKKSLDERIINSTERELLKAPGAHVLVVDDNPMNLMVFKSLLKRTEVVVDTANDGDMGLSLMAKTKYDIVFIDHMMPGKDGIETLQIMKNDENNPNRNTCAVCLTANAISGAKEEYIDAGFNDYLSKPIDHYLLEKMLIDYLPEEKISYVAAKTHKAKSKNYAETETDIEPRIAALKEIDALEIDEAINKCGEVSIYLSTLDIFHS